MSVCGEMYHTVCALPGSFTRSLGLAVRDMCVCVVYAGQFVMRSIFHVLHFFMNIGLCVHVRLREGLHASQTEWTLHTEFLKRNISNA